jgi:hypothetical protein
VLGLSWPHSVPSRPAPPHPTQRQAPAHPHGPSEPGGSGSRVKSSVLGGVGTRLAGPRSSSRARAAAAAPGPRCHPTKRSRAARGAPPAPRAGARAAAPARHPGRGVVGCGKGLVLRDAEAAASCTCGWQPRTSDLHSASPDTTSPRCNPSSRQEPHPHPTLLKCAIRHICHAGQNLCPPPSQTFVLDPTPPNGIPHSRFRFLHPPVKG